MTFFEQQESARSKSFLMVGYFVLAVVGIIISLHVIVSLVLGYAFKGTERALIHAQEFGYQQILTNIFTDHQTFIVISGLTLVVVSLGSLYKVLALRKGGEVVAESLGGKRILADTKDYHERRILNIVEEVAIASGVAVPPVFLLAEEDGINAFAAGFRPKDAVIGVSAGCVHYLTREELQGVVAHEFSHIINGDMRLNIRLMGLLHGILMISIIGQWIMRSGVRSRGFRYGARRRESDTNLQVILIGVGMLVVGSIGVFFGRLIKAAVSRQREFLADASAVQFTRNPLGISGALQKIGGFVYGSQFENPYAEEASHLFFADGLKASFLNMLSTHPPLLERIKRIDPSFRGKCPEVVADNYVYDSEGNERANTVSAFAASGGKSGSELPKSEVLLNELGHSGVAHLAFAKDLIASLPILVKQATKEPYGSMALVYALLLDEQEEIRDLQLIWLAKLTDEALFREVRKLHAVIREIEPSRKLPIVELLLPSLANISLRQYSTLVETIRVLVEADKDVSVFEFALSSLIRVHLDEVFGKSSFKADKYKSFNALAQEFVVIVSYLSICGSESEEEARKAFDAALLSVNPQLSGKLEFNSNVSAREVSLALARFESSVGSLKKALIVACGACICSDGRLKVAEYEVVRVVCITLDCPLPPFVAGRNPDYS